MDMAAKYPIIEMALTRGIRLTTRGISVPREIIHILGIYQRGIKK
jgi:hypothetical protein